MLAIVWLLQRRFARGMTSVAGAGRGRARRPARADAAGAITVVAKRGIGPKAQVAVVEIDGSRYVLGITEGGVSMLDRIDPAVSEAADDDATRPALRDVAGDAPLTPPVPLLRSQARAERTARTQRTAPSERTTSTQRPATMTARDAAHVLRRALGA